MNTTFPSEDMARNATRVWQLAKSIKVAMISTRATMMVELDGPQNGLQNGPQNGTAQPQADKPGTRPVRARFQDDSNVIWFILPRQNNLVAKGESAKSMLVTFSNGGEGDHIAFNGMASLSEDRGMMEKLWDSHADIHFPQGPETGDAVLMRFEPHTAHFWTGGQDFASFAVHYITAKLTGEAQKVGKRGMVMPM